MYTFRYPSVRIIAIDVSDKTLSDAAGFVDTRKGDIVAKVDAQNVMAVLNFINSHTDGLHCSRDP